jgi:hypothetical protein
MTWAMRFEGFVASVALSCAEREKVRIEDMEYGVLY